VCAGIAICVAIAGSRVQANDAAASLPAVTSNAAAGSSAVPPPDNTDKPTAEFDEMLQTTQSSTLGLATEAEHAIADARYDRALQMIKVALHRNNDVLDLHRLYAEALEGKLSEQPQNKKDPLLYEQAVKEWLIVMRTEVGEESGINVHGAGGIFDNLYQDDDNYVKARYHLKQLTGLIPHPWETDKKYLARVLSSPSHAVSGKLVQKPPAEADADSVVAPDKADKSKDQ
jgi:hypothetical protein